MTPGTDDAAAAPPAAPPETAPLEPADPGPAHLETIAVTSGRPAREPDAPLNHPPVFASTYVGSPPGASEVLGYGRYGNPTWAALEETIGALEVGRAITFGSGMAAVHAVLTLLPPQGVLVLPRHCYLGVATAAEAMAARDGLEIRRVDIADTDQVLAAARGADLVWVESPTNPMIEVADLPAITGGTDVAVVVDNTFATPLLQRPLTLGADVVVHSATKFMSGHSDALLGAVVVDAADTERFDRLDLHRRIVGAIPGTMEAWLVLRGLRTLPLRIERAQSNASVLAERLSNHRAVHAVRFPGLATDPGHQRASAAMAGPGSLLSIELADADAADRFTAALRIWVFATSLGGVDSSLERRRRWAGELPSVPEGLIRMSVGIEHVEDLWADLRQALDILG